MSKREKPVENFVNTNREKRLAERVTSDTSSRPARKVRTLKGSGSAWPFDPTKAGSIPDKVVITGVRGVHTSGPYTRSRPSAVRGPMPGSLMHRISLLGVGEYVYIESEQDRLLSIQRQVQKTKPRLAASMRHMKFVVANYTAVAAQTNTDVRYLVRVERTA